MARQQTNLAEAPSVDEAKEPGRLLLLTAKIGPDILLLALFSALLLVLGLIFRAGIHLKEGAILLPSALALGFFAVAFVTSRGNLREKVREILRDWLPFVGLNFVYQNLRMYTGLIRPVPIDPALDRADRALFGGTSPTLWMGHVQTPILTDLMALAYGLYFILPLTLIALLYFRHRREDLRELQLAIVMVFLAGFLLFILFPAGPPRFYGPLRPLFDPPQLTSYFGVWEWSQSAWDSVNPVKIYASFPSLHCALAMVTFLYACRFSDLLKRRFVIPAVVGPLCASLWLSTVYLRHHWVVDVLAGWMLGLLCFKASRMLEDSIRPVRRAMRRRAP